MPTRMSAITHFRYRELRGLGAHIKRFGPLPPISAAVAATPAARHRLPNPFLPTLNPKTGRWAPPKYSLRRQAELIRKAKSTGLLHLLPPGPKLARPSLVPDSPILSRLGRGAWSKPIDWVGDLNTKPKEGSQLGVHLYAGKKRMFKGHKWERVADERERKRRILMRDMSKRVSNYKSYYHRRKPNPLKPARSSKAAKLPF